MIKVKYSINDEGIYTYLDVKGHANSADKGQDLICAAASTILFGLLNGLDDITEIEIKELNNHIEVINDSKSNKANYYLELALIQLKTIEESYPKNIKIERTKLWDIY